MAVSSDKITVLCKRHMVWYGILFITFFTLLNYTITNHLDNSV